MSWPNPTADYRYLARVRAETELEGEMYDDDDDEQDDEEYDTDCEDCVVDRGGDYCPECHAVSSD